MNAAARDAGSALSRRGWLILGSVLLVLQLPLLHRFVLRGPEPTKVSLGSGYAQSFEDNGVVRRDFWSSGGDWRVMDGALFSPGVRNNPLWLQGTLPRDVRIEFDVQSQGTDGDIKVELFGDGLNHASGYVLIDGGWKNTVGVLARLDEHGEPLRSPRDFESLTAASKVRLERAASPVQPGQTYRWRIERRGAALSWFIDEVLFLAFEDPHPLEGPGHDRFGFSSWDTPLVFDNLRITPLSGPADVR